MSKKQNKGSGEGKEFPGYPHYPEGQDIFNKDKVERELDPDTRQKKDSTLPGEGRNEKDFTADVSGADLDVPGSEMDDDQEEIGSEDEENNFYSLGGDNHESLEEQGFEDEDDQ